MISSPSWKMLDFCDEIVDQPGKSQEEEGSPPSSSFAGEAASCPLPGILLMKLAANLPRVPDSWHTL